MSAISSFFQNIFYSIPTIGIADILDIAIVTFLLYKLIRLILNSHVKRAAFGIILLIAVTLLTEMLNMYTIHWILSKVLELGVIAIVIVFQPELRRILERFGRRADFSLLDRSFAVSNEEMMIRSTVSACEKMSQKRVGALIVFERTVSLDQYYRTGTMIDATVSEQLLCNLFFPNASLHDGAVMICNGRVAAAGCVMPLSDSQHLPWDLGTRHRAGVGISEVSDAVVVIVSEETGTVSVASGGILKRHLSAQTLEKLLISELLPDKEVQKTSWLEQIRSFWNKEIKK